MTRESVIEGDIVDFAIRRGWWQMKIEKASVNGPPDRVFIRRGRTVWIEVKATDEVPTRQQLKRHQEMRDHGAEVYWTDNLEEAMQWLN